MTSIILFQYDSLIFNLFFIYNYLSLLGFLKYFKDMFTNTITVNKYCINFMTNIYFILT